MNEPTKRLTVEQIQADMKATGLKIDSCTWITHGLSGLCGCPMGIYAYARGESGHGEELAAFCDVTFGADYVMGFTTAFDTGLRFNPYSELRLPQRTRDGHVDGLAARAALLPGV